MQRKISSRKYLSNPLLIASALILIAGSGAYFYRSKITTPKNQPVPGKSNINYSPPTEEEKNPARDQPVKPNQINTPEGPKNKVIPSITSADKQEVRAFVAGVNEEGGACTAVATMGSQSVTATSQGFSNVNYTSCPAMKFSTPLKAGKWSVIVSYHSATSEGSSEPFTFEVQ